VCTGTPRARLGADRGCERVPGDALEELLSFGLGERRGFLDDHGRDVVRVEQSAQHLARVGVLLETQERKGGARHGRTVAFTTPSK